eukprot:800761-Rhodomonas_salina.3
MHESADVTLEPSATSAPHFHEVHADRPQQRAPDKACRAQICTDRTCMYCWLHAVSNWRESCIMA